MHPRIQPYQQSLLPYVRLVLAIVRHVANVSSGYNQLERNPVNAFNLLKKTCTAHVMLTTKHVYIEVRISHVILYAFLDRGYEFPIQGIGAIDWKSLFSIFNAVINLTEQSTDLQVCF